jgi:hypothetical protein
MPRSFPRLFAVVRNAYTPCLQILQAEALDEENIYNYRSRRDLVYTILSLPLPERLDGRRIFEHTEYNQVRSIETLKYRHPISGDIQEVLYWYTPFYLTSRSLPNIPILEFQYRSWLPGDYEPFPLDTDTNRFFRILREIEEERLREIRVREDEGSRGRRWEPTYYDDYPYPNRYIENRRNSLIRMATPPRPEPVARIVEVPVTVERIVVQQKILPLPKDVGLVLLANARKGSDSCPIAATPFAECEKLSISSCFHIFDSNSLAIWQTDHQTCPVCRSKLENVVTE